MSHTTSACRALAVAGILAGLAALPSMADAQCTSAYELYVGATPRNMNFTFRDPVTSNFMLVETQYAGATAGRTWSWDGGSWHRVVDQGPLDIFSAMVTQDTGRSRTVAVTQTGQTWEWDGVAWSQVGTCPSTRCSGAAIAYDAGRAVTMLVTGGGLPGGAAAETWEWNGSAWTQRSVTGPSNRNSATLVYDPARNVTVLYGGQVNQNVGPPAWLSDLWEFNGTAWTQRTTGPGPGLNSLACAVYHAPLGGIVIYGGRDLTLKTQMWVWNGTAWTSIASTQAGSQLGANMFSDPVAGKLTLFGRIMPANNNEYGKYGWQIFSRLDGQAWLSGPKSDDFQPFGGDRAVMAFDSDRGVTVLFGGMMPTGDFLYNSTTWEFDGQSWTKSAATGPVGRTFATMAYDSIRHRMVLVGGTTGGGDVNPNNGVAETWEYDGTSWALVSTDAAAGRRSHTMAFDPVRGKMIIQGGHITGGTQRFDTQEWDGSTWTQVAATAPSNRIPMIYDRNAQYILGTQASSTLRLAPAGWTQVVPAGVGALHLEWHNGLQRIVGYSSTTRGTYSWTGSAWQLIPVTFAPPARGDSFATAYDSRHDRVQIWGGFVGGTASELWQLVRPSADLGRQGGVSGADGQLDNNDFIVFISSFFASDPRADLGTAGGLVGSDQQFNNNDFIAFISLFFNGCGL